MEVQHSETDVQGDAKKRWGLLGTPTSIYNQIYLLHLQLQTFILFTYGDVETNSSKKRLNYIYVRVRL